MPIACNRTNPYTLPGQSRQFRQACRWSRSSADHIVARVATVGREYDPVVGKWYRDLDDDESFQVLSVNEDDALVEIQHVDGDIEEIDLDTWAELDVEPTEEPEGWSGSTADDDLDDDDDWDDEDDDDWDDDDDDDDDEDDDDEDDEEHDY
jgi:hypothetical protein